MPPRSRHDGAVLRRAVLAVFVAVVAGCGSGGSEVVTARGNAATVATSAERVPPGEVSAATSTTGGAPVEDQVAPDGTTTTSPAASPSIPTTTTLPPASTTTTTTTTTTAAPTPALAARIELAATTVAAGGALDGVLVVSNPGDESVHLRAGACHPKWAVYLAPAQRPVHPSDCRAGALVLHPGETRMTFSMTASLSACSQAEPPNGGLPPCNPPPDVMPALPTGRYEATLDIDATGLTAAPVPVRVVPASPST